MSGFQRQIPGGNYANETGIRQVQIPGDGYLNDTVFVAPTSDALLQEDGSYILQEDGFAILLDGTANVITADAGSYSLTGQDAGLLRGYLVTADAGAYVLTGQDATLSVGNKTLIADAGSYTLTGQNATLKYGKPGGAISRRRRKGAALRNQMLV